MTQLTPEQAREAEEQAWLDDGIGQPAPRDSAGAISKALMFIAAAAVLAIIVASLAACATPATKTVVQTVQVPVAVQPIKAAQVPTPPAPLGPRPQSLSAAADALLSKVCELEAYVLRADPLLRVSAGEAQQALPKYAECERP